MGSPWHYIPLHVIAWQAGLTSAQLVGLVAFLVHILRSIFSAILSSWKSSTGLESKLLYVFGKYVKVKVCVPDEASSAALSTHNGSLRVWLLLRGETTVCPHTTFTLSPPPAQ